MEAQVIICFTCAAFNQSAPSMRGRPDTPGTGVPRSTVEGLLRSAVKGACHPELGGGASGRHGSILKGFEDFCLNAQALTVLHVPHIHSTAEGACHPELGGGVSEEGSYSRLTNLCVTRSGMESNTEKEEGRGCSPGAWRRSRCCP